MAILRSGRRSRPPQNGRSGSARTGLSSRIREFGWQLRQWRVYRVAAVYAAAAFVLLEVMDLVLPQLGFPPWTYRALLIALVAGFPVAVVLGWIFDVAPGERRLSDAIVLRAEVRAVGMIMGDEDPECVQRALDRSRSVLVSLVEHHGGRIAEAPGNTFIAIFEDAMASFACARATRREIERLNGTLPAIERVHYRFAVAGGELIESRDGPGGAGIESAYELAAATATDRITVGDSVRARIDTAATDGDTADMVRDGLADGPPQLEGIDLPLPSRPSIAIMPFTTIGDSAPAAAVAEGLRIDITNALMKISEIFLTAPSSMNHFRDMDGQEVAAKLGTRHVLEGVVRTAGDRVRVTVQLTDSVAGSLAWSERYDRKLDEGFELQDEIAARVITELDVKLSLGEQARVWHKCLTHPEARGHFFEGLREFFQSTAESVAAARARFERVAALVPDSPVGPTWTALALWLQATHGWTENCEETERLAIEWAERAASMEDADGQAHTVLGAVLLLQRRFDEALATARDSVAIRPGCNTANGILANVLLHCGEYDGAILHARRAIRIGPVYPSWFLEILSASYREAGEVSLATAVAREALRLSPKSVSARLVLVSALVRENWLTEARHIAREVRDLEPGFEVQRHLEHQPFRSADVLQRYGSELRAAGLPG
jgi:adenylate cyclase